MMNRWHEIINDEVIVPYESGNEDFARVALSSKVLPISEEILDRLEGLKEQQTDTIINIGNDNLSASEITLMMAIGVSILAIIVGIIIAIITANSITSPIRMVMERMKAMANGDLSIEPLETKLVDESGQLVEATNEMNENMRNLLMQVSEVSETVSSQSEELTQAANEVNAGSEQVATTMTEIADGTETQANHANQLSSAMGMFVSKIDEVNNNGIDMQASSNDVLEMTENGFSLMKSSTTQMNTIHEIVRNAFSEVHKLSDFLTFAKSDVIDAVYDGYDPNLNKDKLELDPSFQKAVIMLTAFYYENRLTISEITQSETPFSVTHAIQNLRA